MVVQRNVFFAQLPIHKKYDLKGSSVNRSGKISSQNISTTLKDNDMEDFIVVPTNNFQKLVMQADSDAQFLFANSIMDYSLLLGIYQHNRKDSRLCPQTRNPKSNDVMSTLHEIISQCSTSNDGSFGKLRNQDSGAAIDYRNVKRQLVSAFSEEDFEKNKQDISAALEALNFNNVRVVPYWNQAEGGMRAFLSPRVFSADKLKPVVVFLAIIDVLQVWNAKKRLENIGKTRIIGPALGLGFTSNISAVEPYRYKQRFMRMLTERIRKVESTNVLSNCSQYNLENWLADGEN